jgi:hypothetical protein
MTLKTELCLARQKTGTERHHRAETHQSFPKQSTTIQNFGCDNENFLAGDRVCLPLDVLRAGDSAALSETNLAFLNSASLVYLRRKRT